MQNDPISDRGDIKQLKQQDSAPIKQSIIHAVGALGLLTGALVNPVFYVVSILAIWGLSNLFKKTCPSIETHGRHALNFHLTLLCCLLISFGLLAGVYVWLGQIELLLVILNAMLVLVGICFSLYKALNGYLDETLTTYPFAYPFFKRPKM